MNCLQIFLAWYKILTQDDCIIYLIIRILSDNILYFARYRISVKRISPGIIQTIERFISIYTKYFIPKMADPDLNAGYATLSNELHCKLIRRSCRFFKRNILMLQSEGFHFCQ